MLKILFTVSFLVSCSICHYTDDYLTPDLELLREICQEIYERIEDIIENVTDEFDIPYEDAMEVWHSMRNENLNFEEYADCGPCLAFVRGIQGFINQGLEFEDVRDFAVEICKNVTVIVKGYDGDIMCDGLIDNYGPPVYYVLNVTTMDAREICEFHNNCPSAQSSMTESEFAKRESMTNKGNSFHKQSTGAVSRGDFQFPRKPRDQMIKLAHITDVHLDEFYAPGSPDQCDLPICCRDDLPGTGSAGPWGSYGCALPLHTLDLVLTYINKLDVDVIINTGDTPNHAIWLESQEGQLRQNEVLVDAIKRNIPGVPGHVAIGNHDMFPTNLFYRPSALTEQFLLELRLMYQDLANFTEEQGATFEDGAYYISEIQPGLKIMSYNTNYGGTKNFYGVLLQDSQDWLNMVNFMEEQLDLARANGDKIILLGHHFMGRGFTFWETFINDVMMRNSDVIILHLLGHSHNDFYKMALDDAGNAVHVNFVTGSVKTARNPTFKIIYLDSDSFLPMEFDTYFINISKTLDGQKPAEVEFMYSSYTDYQMEDLSPISYQNFTDRMEEDEYLFDLFCWNEDSRISNPDPCDERCREKFFCGRRTTSAESYDKCRDSYLEEIL